MGLKLALNCPHLGNEIASQRSDKISLRDSMIDQGENELRVYILGNQEEPTFLCHFCGADCENVGECCWTGSVFLKNAKNAKKTILSYFMNNYLYEHYIPLNLCAIVMFYRDLVIQ